jgi:hypothetical protein
MKSYMLTWVVIPLTNPIWFMSMCFFMYRDSLGKNLSSKYLYIALIIAIGLKSHQVGMFGQALFKGTSLALKIGCIRLKLYGFHKSEIRFQYLVSLMWVSENPSSVIALLYDIWF